jgi:hypothetical protein
LVASGIVVVLALLFAVFLALLWSAARMLPPVRVSFLGSTNDPAMTLVWGVFEIVNNLGEPLTSYGGVFEKWNGEKWSDTVGTYIANFGGEKQYEPGTTNIVQTVLPRTAGRYRLAFRYYPKSMNTPKFYASPRYRLLQFFVRKGIITTRNHFGRVVIQDGSYMIDPKKPLILLLDPFDVPPYEPAQGAAQEQLPNDK